MNKEEMLKAFERLNEICHQQNIKGEIGIVGGAAMVLAYGAQRATKDVDAIFEPAQELRKAAQLIAAELHLPPDWLNDAVKNFFPPNLPTKNQVIRFDHLLVWVPEPSYMLAMKAISARFDSRDAQDVIQLCKILKLKKADQALEIIEDYYPHNQIPAKTIFFLEEIFEQDDLKNF